MPPDLSVSENRFVGRWPMRGGLLYRRAMDAAAHKKRSERGFDQPMATPVGELTVAGRQQVGVDRAPLLDTRPLIFNELYSDLEEVRSPRIECWLWAAAWGRRFWAAKNDAGARHASRHALNSGASEPTSTSPWEIRR